VGVSCEKIAVLTFVALLILLISCEGNDYQTGTEGEGLYPQQETPNLSNTNSAPEANPNIEGRDYCGSKHNF